MALGHCNDANFPFETRAMCRLFDLLAHAREARPQTLLKHGLLELYAASEQRSTETMD
jgi:hypothetical protein